MEAYRVADLERRLTTLKAQLEESQRVTKAMAKRRAIALARVENIRARRAQAWANMPCDYLDAELERESAQQEQLMVYAEENFMWALARESKVCEEICKVIQRAYEY